MCWKDWRQTDRRMKEKSVSQKSIRKNGISPQKETDRIRNGRNILPKRASCRRRPKPSAGQRLNSLLRLRLPGSAAVHYPT